VFIAHDFTIGGTLPTDLETLSSHPPRDLSIHWSGESGPQIPGGLWEQIVKPGIDQCDRFLAFADLPNANVGFEIGYAMGKKKEVGLARVRSPAHRWLKCAPFKGEYIQHLDTVDRISQFLSLPSWPKTEYDAVGDGDSILFLCPRKSGAAFRKFKPDSWIMTDGSRWQLRSIPGLFKNVGLVVWVVAPHNEGDGERDGSENAALSVLAGFAEGNENLELLVLSGHHSRKVADVASHVWSFESVEQYKKLLHLINSGWQSADRPRDVPFREWLPRLFESPAYSGFNLTLGERNQVTQRDENAFTVEKVPRIRQARKKNRKLAWLGIGAALIIAAAFILPFLWKSAPKIVFAREIQTGTVIRLKADNFECDQELRAVSDEMGTFKIEIPKFKIREENRDTDAAPRVFLQVLKPENLIFENYAWDENESYRSAESWPLPHPRNQITARLITKGQWDQNQFAKVKKELLKRLHGAPNTEVKDFFEEILKESGLTVEALRKSVSEKQLPDVPLENALQKVQDGTVVSSTPGTGAPLNQNEKDALKTLIASTGVLIKASPGSRSRPVPLASGLVVGEHFVITSPSILPKDFRPASLPAELPEVQSLSFSLAENPAAERDWMSVQDVLVIRPEYVVLMVPNVGRMVRDNLGRHFPKDQVEAILSQRFVFLTPDGKDQKCVAVGYPIASEDTPGPFKRLLSIRAGSSPTLQKRVSVGRVYSSSSQVSTHTAATMQGSEGGPVAFFHEGAVGIMGFDRGGMWLGDGYRISAASNLDSSTPERPLGSRQVDDLIKSQIIEYAIKEIESLPEIMQPEAAIWKSYFQQEKATYELRKKLAEMRATVWACRNSANSRESYQLFRKGWLMFRAVYGQKKNYLSLSIEPYEKLVEAYPNYYIGWLRLGEAYDKNGQREKALEVLKKGYQEFKVNPNEPSWRREIEASFLNTLSLVCGILGEQVNTSPTGPDPAFFRSESDRYLAELSKVCPYHPTLIGSEK